MTTEQKPNREEFLRDLYALLAKHRMAIAFECDDSSDMHGIYGARISVIHKTPTLNETVWASVEGYELDAYSFARKRLFSQDAPSA